MARFYQKINILIAVAVVLIAANLYRSKSHHSVIILALTYLSRPHTYFGVNHVHQPVSLPSAWNGSYMSLHPEIWTYVLTDSDKKSFDAAIHHFEKFNISLYQLTIKNFPLSSEVIQRINSWKIQLSEKGIGFQLIKGVPVRKWTMKQCEIFFFALGKYLGIPGAQDNEGTLLGHVADIGVSKNVERPYRQKVEISFHCDGSDIVGLLCIHPAKSGGASRIISSVAMYNELLKLPDGQQLISRLFDRVLSFTRKSFGLASYLAISPLRMDSNGVLRTFWNQDFYQKSYVHPNGTLTTWGEKDPVALRAIQAYDSILNDDYEKSKMKFNCGQTNNNVTDQCDYKDASKIEFGLDMMLEQGDIQLVSNHFVLHARTEFEDYSDNEIEFTNQFLNHQHKRINDIGKRELLRLWVSDTSDHLSWRHYIDKQIDFIRVISSLVEAIIYYR